MKVVIDTNVVVSGIFFGGNPRRVLEAVIKGNTIACASPEIISEYEDIIEEMIQRRQGRLRKDILSPFVAELKIYEPKIRVSACRDPEDDKFLSCALDAKAFYIISGDKDLLDMKQYKEVEIVTAADFCKRYLIS